MRLPADVAAGIVAHARAEAPHECCGVLSGRSGAIERGHALRNTHPTPATRYEIDASQLFALEFESLPAAGREIVGIYHSHPATPAYPSATDLALAVWSDAVYVICSLADPAAPSLRAFRIAGETVTELSVEIA